MELKKHWCSKFVKESLHLSLTRSKQCIKVSNNSKDSNKVLSPMGRSLCMWQHLIRPPSRTTYKGQCADSAHL